MSALDFFLAIPADVIIGLSVLIVGGIAGSRVWGRP